MTILGTMVVDALAAIGLAGNIVQFVDFGLKLFSQSREIYQSGTSTLTTNNDLEKIIQSLRQFADQFACWPALRDASTPGISWEEQELHSISQECRSTANSLLKTLERLRRRGGNSKWSSFRQALEVMWKKPEIDQTVNTLSAFRGQLSLCLLQILRNDQSAIFKKFDHLSEACQQLGMRTTDMLQDLKSEIINLLSQLHGSDSVEETAEKLAEKLIHSISLLNQNGEKMVKEQKVLESLCFEAIRVRHDQIPDAYKKTFEWIYDLQMTTFISWLSSGDGIYWISGKVGSGKSTLMKFISDHLQTFEALQDWAANQRLVTASFYFWNAGTDMQKSLQGLLQSLLYDVFRQCPELIPEIVPSRYQNKLTCSEPWTQKELKQAFTLLQKQTTLSAMFCFFIDGLDEYKGNHRETVQLLVNTAQSHNIKICISSRPWNIFQDAFGTGHNQKLFMEDLTWNDIEIYVRTQLEDEPIFAQKSASDKKYQKLISSIIWKAEGVFLWAALAVKSLLSGLADADTIEELEMRLDELPPDLEQLFVHMFDRTDKAYKKEAAKLFLTVLAAKNPRQRLPLAALSYINEDVARILHAPVKPISARDILTGLQSTARRVNARCSSFLSMRLSTSLQPWAADIKWTIEGGFSTHNIENKFWLFGEVYVEFVHRSVRDFFSTEEMKETLKNQTGCQFRPLNQICLGILGAIKSLRGLPGRQIIKARADIYLLIDKLMDYARASEILHNSPELGVLDELFAVLRFVNPILLEVRWNSPLKEEDISVDASTAINHVFSQHSIKWDNVLWCSYSGYITSRNLTLYVKEKINSGDPDYGADKHLLDWFLQGFSSYSRWGYNHDYSTAVLLIDRYGANQLMNPALCLDMFSFSFGTGCALPWTTNPRTWSPRPTLWQALILSLRFLNPYIEEDDEIYVFYGKDYFNLFSIALDNGMDPNEMFGGMTLWIEAMRNIFFHSWGARGLIEMFLEHGANPNQISTISRPVDGCEWQPRILREYDLNTPWGLLLEGLYGESQLRDIWDLETMRPFERTIELFLEAGAHKSLVFYPNGPSSPAMSISELLKKILPADVASRLQLKYFQGIESEGRSPKRIKME